MKKLIFALILCNGLVSVASATQWICAAQGRDWRTNMASSVFGMAAATEDEARSNALNECLEQELTSCEVLSCFQQ